MNNSLFDDIDIDDEFPRVFCPQEEMKNLSTHLYLQHQGALNGRITTGDPCEEIIIAISPKAFCLLMLAKHDLVFSPVSTKPHIGIVLEWQCNFGRLCVYSQGDMAWNTPFSGSGHIALTFLFEDLNAKLVDQIRAKFPELLLVIETNSAAVNAKMDYWIGDGCYLEDISNAIFRWLNQLYEVEKFIRCGYQQH